MVRGEGTLRRQGLRLQPGAPKGLVAGTLLRARETWAGRGTNRGGVHVDRRNPTEVYRIRDICVKLSFFFFFFFTHVSIRRQ